MVDSKKGQVEGHMPAPRWGAIEASVNSDLPKVSIASHHPFEDILLLSGERKILQGLV